MYSKTGKTYSVDITGFDSNYISDIMADSMYFEEPMSINNGHKISAVHGKHIEFFEIFLDEPTEPEVYDDPCRIGFMVEDEPEMEEDEEDYE